MPLLAAAAFAFALNICESPQVLAQQAQHAGTGAHSRAGAPASNPQGASAGNHHAAGPTPQEIAAAAERARSNPRDAKLRFDFAETLRKAGKYKLAAREYLEATAIDPTLYVAYHQLTQTAPDATAVDQAIERLSQLKEKQPKDLMLRVALSELYEKKAHYYQAARTLIDLVYQNVIPDKYVTKVNARIRYLLSKSKDAQTAEKATSEDDDQEAVPLPLPEASLRRNLAASKIREPKVMPGVGHAPLLP